MNWLPWTGGKAVTQQYYRNILIPSSSKCCVLSIVVCVYYTFSNKSLLSFAGHFLISSILIPRACSYLWSSPFLFCSILSSLWWALHIFSPWKIKRNIENTTQHLFMWIFVCYVTTGGVGVQDLFHHDWTEDTPAEAKGSQGEEREEWLIPMSMFINGLCWEELRISHLLILSFGARRQSPSCDCKKDLSMPGLHVCFWR